MWPDTPQPFPNPPAQPPAATGLTLPLIGTSTQSTLPPHSAFVAVQNGSEDVTLPLAATCPGVFYFLVGDDEFHPTLHCQGGDNVRIPALNEDRGATYTLPGSNCFLYSDGGANWLGVELG